MAPQRIANVAGKLPTGKKYKASLVVTTNQSRRVLSHRPLDQDELEEAKSSAMVRLWDEGYPESP